MNKITYLDGMRLHRALVAGINNVILNQEYLNKINVFPVPDGDTGTNMAFTLTSILDSTQKKVYPRVDDMLAHIADAALDGARGMSGGLLAGSCRVQCFSYPGSRHRMPQNSPTSSLRGFAI